MVTPFPELDAVLADLTEAARAVLGATYVGSYLQGSFALGADDAESDADVVVVATVPPAGRARRGRAGAGAPRRGAGRAARDVGRHHGVG